MKIVRITVVIVITFAAATSVAESDAQKVFKELKTLAGTWEGTSSEGKPVTVTFRETANVSAILSEINGHENMITMFYLDGSRLLMTHYCAAGNQPRMAEELSPDGKTLVIRFIDATNVLPSQPGHMEQLNITMPDTSHHTEIWQFAANDGQKMREIFELKRKN
jgi:hypothetical protein